MPAMKRKATNLDSMFKAYKKRKPTYKKSTQDNLGKISGKVAANKTTLALAPGPFTEKVCDLLYENALQQVAGAAML